MAPVLLLLNNATEKREPVELEKSEDDKASGLHDSTKAQKKLQKTVYTVVKVHWWYTCVVLL